MSDNPFAQVLAEELAMPDTAGEALSVLQEFCRGVELSTDGRVECRLERGYPLTYGQEWRVVLHPWLGDTPQLLLRSYVPLSSWPVTLDLHGGPLTRCSSAQELTSELQAFLRDPTVLQSLRFAVSGVQEGGPSPDDLQDFLGLIESPSFRKTLQALTSGEAAATVKRLSEVSRDPDVLRALRVIQNPKFRQAVATIARLPIPGQLVGT